jgi:hypothetical protein
VRVARAVEWPAVRRRLLNLLTSLSLLLCIAASMLWMRSFNTGCAVAKFDRGSGGMSATLVRGAVGLSWGPARDWRMPRRRLDYFSFPAFPWVGDALPDAWFPGIGGGSWPAAEPVPSQLRIVPTHDGAFAMPVSRTEWGRLGFVYQLGLIAYPDGTATLCSRRLKLPAWFTASAAAGMGAPSLWFVGRRIGRSRRRRVGLCAACGYDLRASPERCPECGAAVTGAAVPP